MAGVENLEKNAIFPLDIIITGLKQHGWIKCFSFYEYMWDQKNIHRKIENQKLDWEEGMVRWLFQSQHMDIQNVYDPVVGPLII